MMIIRKLTPGDLAELSSLHKNVFDRKLFSVNYPLKYLNIYFEYLLKMNEYCYAALEENKHLIGYLIGGFKTQEAVDLFTKQYKHIVFFNMLKHPLLSVKGLLKFIKRIFHKNKKSRSDLQLFLIGVSPFITQKGAGSKLLEKFEHDIKNDGYSQFGLYVHTWNKEAITFYEKKGFEPEFKSNDLLYMVKAVK